MTRRAKTSPIAKFILGGAGLVVLAFAGLCVVAVATSDSGGELSPEESLQQAQAAYEQAREDLAAGRLDEAQRSVSRARVLEPDLPGLAALSDQLATKQREAELATLPDRLTEIEAAIEGESWTLATQRCNAALAIEPKFEGLEAACVSIAPLKVLAEAHSVVQTEHRCETRSAVEGALDGLSHIKPSDARWAESEQMRGELEKCLKRIARADRREAAKKRQAAQKKSEPKAKRVSCCKVCRSGKACGNSCISRSKTCHKPPGCACNG